MRYALGVPGTDDLFADVDAFGARGLRLRMLDDLISASRVRESFEDEVLIDDENSDEPPQIVDPLNGRLDRSGKSMVVNWPSR